MPNEEFALDGLRARVAQLHWHHSIDLGGGLVTPGHKPPALCAGEAAVVFDRIALAGRSILDVDAWNGYFSFEAKRRGAGRVLATDSFCWTDPHFRGRETFDLARDRLGLPIEARQIDAADLTPESVGDFDVVLFLGVFYHRIDAVEVLRKVARLARHVLVVETQLALRNVSGPAMAFYPGRELGGDATNWWGPNEQCMVALLAGLGFGDIEVAATPAAHYGRAVFHAWRSTELRLRRLPPQGRLWRNRPILRSRLVRRFAEPVRLFRGL
jgi:tRNA (mo5U34)-methyltransferase